MTPASITQWLQEPHRDIDQAELEDLLSRYPYFAPLHYMASALKQEDGRPVQLSGNPALYAGNWLLFYQMMQQAAAISIHSSAPVVPETLEAPEATAVPEPEPHETIIIPLVPDVLITEEEPQKEEPLIQPVFTEDYFLHQGIQVDDQLPADLDASNNKEAVAAASKEETMAGEDPKSLMVVMSFTEWLMHFRSKSQKEKEDEEDRKAVKHMWQKEKLAAALEEEDDEIPENVFEMAVNSISKEGGLVTESLAEILAKQGKWEKAIEMYRKLSLRNPQKSAYFAQQIASIQKNLQ